MRSQLLVLGLARPGFLARYGPKHAVHLLVLALQSRAGSEPLPALREGLYHYIGVG